MSDLENGGVSSKRLPTIQVGWDAENQIPLLKFEATEFRSWQMVLMVLEAARQQADFQLKMALTANLQRQALEAQQNEQIRRRILGG